MRVVEYGASVGGTSRQRPQPTPVSRRTALRRLGASGALIAGVPIARGQESGSSVPFREIDALDVSCGYAYDWRYRERTENESRTHVRTKRYRYRDVLRKRYDLEDEIGYYAIYTESNGREPAFPWQLTDGERYYHAWDGGWSRTRRTYLPDGETWILSANVRIRPQRGEYTFELPTVYYDRRVVTESSDGSTTRDEEPTPLYGFSVRRELPDALPVRSRVRRQVPTSYGSGTERARWVIRRAESAE